MPPKRSQSKTRTGSTTPKKSPPASNKKKEPVVEDRPKKREPEPEPPTENVPAKRSQSKTRAGLTPKKSPKKQPVVEELFKKSEPEPEPSSTKKTRGGLTPKKSAPTSNKKKQPVVEKSPKKSEPEPEPSSSKKTRSVSTPKKSPPASNKKKQPVAKKSPKKREPEPEPPSSSEEEEEEEEEEEVDDEIMDDGSDDASESGDDDDKTNTPFTDKNAAWLKPKKKKLLDSSDEDEDEDEDEKGGDDDDDDEDDDDEELEIERETRMLDEELEAEKEEAEEEMRLTISQNTAIYHLPTSDEVEKDVDRVVAPSEIRSHIESILEVLADFKKRREQGRSRVEYVDQLGVFIAELYGYLPELIEYFLMMLGPAETLEFVDASDKNRPLVIRTNTLKARRKDLAAALMKRGVSLDPLAAWSKVGLKIMESPVPVGATPEYLSGMYMLQSAASMCPVLALAPQPKERILDMSAAPGGKTSYMAQLMRNTGYILANDLKPERQKATVANMHRLGVKNVVACFHDGRKMGEIFKNRFDRILLDAPCSGLGVISRDPSVKVQRTMADVHQCAHLQKELLIACIDALKFKGTTGGVMVYSTCSVSVAENEEVVNYALSKRDIRIIDSGLDFGKNGFTRFQQKRFHPSLALTRRFYPHVHNMDGFFVAKIEKLSDMRPEDTLEPGEEVVDDDEEDEEPVASNKNDGKKIKAIKGKGPEQKEKKRKRELLKVTEKQTHVSVPPQKPKKQKVQRQNAKVTKPRRKAPATDA
jgi:ribosomal RNA methyltransferase Nop2